MAKRKKRTVRERVEKRVAQFKVGDHIEAHVYGADEIAGRIVSIDGRQAIIQTKYGQLTVSLTTASKI